MIYLLLIFIILPTLELYLLIKIGAIIGAFNTVLIIFGTGFLGAYLAKKEGLEILRKIKLSLIEGELPAYHLLEGLLVLISGVLLITPGFITDLFGFLILFPGTREFFIKLLINYFNKKIEKGEVEIFFKF